MRLYRGLKGAYRPGEVSADRFAGTDFTDCPATALLYAQGSRGVLLVLDVPEREVATLRVTEELWLNSQARRYMVWGKFDRFIAAALPAKDLRACLRRKGMRSAPHASRTRQLEAVIDVEIRKSTAARVAAQAKSST